MTGPSTKSDSVTRRRTKPARLFRDAYVTKFGEEDRKTLFALYRLDRLPEHWPFAKGMDAKEFLVRLDEFLPAQFDYGWSVRNKQGPLMLIFAAQTAHFVMVEDYMPAPRARSRGVMEAMARFFDDMRKESVLFVRGEGQWKYLLWRLANYGILGHVGRIYGVGVYNGSSQLFQTRK